MLLRCSLPEHHLTTDTRDSVKLAMGLVATMAALVLGLLIAAAKDKYDKEAAGVTQMAAKVIFLDRMLAIYGDETKDVRALLKQMVERVASRMWPDGSSTDAQLDPSASRTEGFLIAIQGLSPRNDLQTTLKSRAQSAAFDLGQMRGKYSSKPTLRYRFHCFTSSHSGWRFCSLASACSPRPMAR